MAEAEGVLGSSGYRFEPRREDFTSSSEGEDYDEEPSRGVVAGRVGNMFWCSCNNCVSLPMKPECCYCRELVHLTHLINDPNVCNCVVDHPEFAAACLQPLTLRIALVGLMAMRGDDIPFPISNRKNKCNASFMCSHKKT